MPGAPGFHHGEPDEDAYRVDEREGLQEHANFPPRGTIP